MARLLPLIRRRGRSSRKTAQTGKLIGAPIRRRGLTRHARNA